LPIWAKRRRPRLLPAHAVVLTVTGRPDDTEPLLEEAERLAEVSGEDHPFLLGYASAVRSWRARLRGDAPRAVELARRALSLLPAEALAQRNFAAGSLGDALRTAGDLAAAEEALAEAIEIGLVGDHAYGTLAAMVWRARVQMEQGRLREAENSFRRALLFVTERGVGLLPAAGLAHLGMGALLYERDELERAERELEEGVGLVQRAREVSNLVWGYVTLSRTRQARGDEEGALTTADDAERVARDAGADLAISIAVSWKERLREWDVGAAASAREHAAPTDGAAAAAPSVGPLTSARLLHARGRHREALRMLEEQLEAAEKAGRGGEIIEILALRSSASWARNEKGRAVADLARALSLAEPEGYVRTFVDEGPPMAEMLSGMLEASRRGSLDLPVPAHYLRKLLAALERDSARAATSAGGLPEGLTGRELEILSLVAAGMSNGRIASELFVGVGTVKTHLNNVNRKLDARSRTQAVARARELNLI
jgi:LuxR family maltose regulon positive regulatory protein